MKNKGNVYNLLEDIRERPSMWLMDDKNLATLETMLHGYYAALAQHGIIEDAPRLNKSQFTSWLNEEKGLGKGAALGWSTILNYEYPDPDVAFDKFFELTEEYKQLEP